MQRTIFRPVSLVVVFLILPLITQAQRRSSEITYSILYDEPQDVYKLLLGFMPVYTDMSWSNVTAGLGADAMIYPQYPSTHEKSGPRPYSIHLHGRTTYATQTDIVRYLHRENTGNDVANFGALNWYTYVEAGGAYHFVDEVGEPAPIKFPVLSSKKDLNSQAYEVQDNFIFDASKRTVVAARLGVIGYQSAVNWGNIDSRTSRQITGFFPTSSATPDTVAFSEVLQQDTITGDGYAFGNVSVGAIYLGTSLAWNWNVAVDPDSHADAVRDVIFTGYADFIIAPVVNMSDMLSLNGNFRAPSQNLEDTFKNLFGFRLGIDIAHSRSFGWGMVGEIGMRPGVKGNGWYAMTGLRFPVFGTNLDNTRESFSK